MINRLEAQIPGKYKMNLSAEDKLKYQKCYVMVVWI